MATKKIIPANDTAIERFMVSADGIKTARAYDKAMDNVVTTGADLVALLRDHKITAAHFGKAKAGDNEHIAARDFLYRLAAHAVKIGGKTLDAAGIAAVFDETVPVNRVISGAPKGGRVEGGRSWSNRISNKVGTQWAKLFNDAAKADEAAAAAAQAAADLAAGVEPAQVSEAEKLKEAQDKCAKFWTDLLQRAYNKTFAEDGAHITGDMIALQAAIKEAAAQTSVKLKAKK